MADEGSPSGAIVWASARHVNGGQDVVRQSPQEKKQLSYEQDRRNVYGENDKSSRKAIPFRKRAVNKANRHADHQIMPITRSFSA